MTDPSQLLLEIANCRWAKSLRGGSTSPHACRTIVGSQVTARFQVPEPWVGEVHRAPLLFISSNPSIDEREVFPTHDASWTPDRIVDFFQNRFAPNNEWVKEGKTLQQDGSRGKSVRFWASARARAGELLEKRESSIQPGIDFALTEVVHCKSLSERGVQEAQKFCSALYLRKILDISVAKVLVVYGVIAREEVCGCLHLWDEVISERKLLGPVTIAEIPRMLIFLPHPSSWMRKTLKANLEGTELSLLRKHLMEPSKCGIS